MKLALCQMRMSADEQTNLERGLDALHRAAAAGADLIVYPELQLHLFFPQYEGRDAADKRRGHHGRAELLSARGGRLL